jgi:hypothetical protein
MTKYEYGFKAYVADDGNYGVDSIITFDFEDFNAEYPSVWEMLDNVHDSQKTEFLLAVLNQDEEALRELAEDYELPLNKLLG